VLSTSITASNHADADGHATTELHAPTGAGNTQLVDERDTPEITLGLLTSWRTERAEVGINPPRRV
jgi:hypothetical protein